MDPNRQVNQSPLGGRTLFILLGGAVFFVLITVGLVACYPISPAAVEAPIDMGSGESQVAEAQATETPTTVPTATATAIPTEIPSPRPTRAYWTPLWDTPYATPEYPPSYESTLNGIRELALENESFAHFNAKVLQYFTNYSADTSFLIAWSNDELNGALDGYLHDVFRSSMRVTQLQEPVYFYECGGKVCSSYEPLETPEPNERVPLYIGVTPSEFMFLTGLTMNMCQAVEDGSIRGYGLAALDGWDSVSALSYIVQVNTQLDHEEFYCSNFDPTSGDFLSVAQDLKEYELISEVKSTLGLDD